MTLSAHGLMMLVIQLVIGGLILWLIWWFVNYVGPPEPIKKVCLVLIALFALIWLVNILMSLAGHPLVNWTG